MPKPEHWQVLFSLWSVQAIAAFGWLLLIPTDTENALAFGFSPGRLALMGTAIVLIAVSFILRLESRRLTFRQTWLNIDSHIVLWDLVYMAAILAVMAAGFFMSVAPLFKSSPLYLAYTARLRPLVLWLGLSGLELAALIAWNRFGKAKPIFVSLRPVWKKTVLLLLLFLFLGVFIVSTRIGITPEANWGAPPVPFLEWQVFLTLALIGVFVSLPMVFSKPDPKWIPFAVYLFTVVLWLSQPINTAFTATPPRAPNFEIYPFSDPQIYAQYAQSALAGNGFLWPEIPARPFYVAFLTWIHLLGNQNYQNIIVLQTLVLALFPVVLYLLGNEIGGKPLGLGLALLAALRDVNSNATVHFASNVTYSKLFLSELPSALLIALATLLSIRWLRTPNRAVWRSLLVGGVLGAAALIRLQSSVLIALIILIAFLIISERSERRVWLKGSILMVIGFTVTVAPWLARNYIAAGGLVFDNPISQTMTMARRWSGSSGNEILPRLPGENDAQYSSRLTRMAIASFRQHPGLILHSAANHFVNNEIDSLLAFPIRDQILSPSELLVPEHAFWKTPLAASQIPLFGFYLLLFSAGVAAAWHWHRLIGLIPLGFGLVYNLWTALFLSSGERFIVPLDWSVHLYEFFGLTILGGLLLSFVQGAHEKVSAWLQKPMNNPAAADEPAITSRRQLILSVALVLLLGAFLPLTESIFPQKYPPKSKDEIVQYIGVAPEEGEIALYGRALYPRYYKAGDGEPGTAKLGYGSEEEARLVFFLVGPQNGLVIFELDHAPQFFPNTSDVYMVGTQMDGYFVPRAVRVIKATQTELYINR